MASIRTAFIERINPHKNPFLSLIAYLQPYPQQTANTDDIKKQSKGTNVVQTPSKPQNTFTKISHEFKSSTFRILNRILHENINNFSQLLDKNRNDFKDC